MHKNKFALFDKVRVVAVPDTGYFANAITVGSVGVVLWVSTNGRWCRVHFPDNRQLALPAEELLLLNPQH